MTSPRAILRPLAYASLICTNLICANLAWAQEKFLGEIGRDEAAALGISARAAMAKSAAGTTPELTKLAGEAMRAFTGGDYNGAFVRSTRLLLRLKGVEDTEGVEVAASYDVKLNRAVYALGEYVEVTLDPLYVPAQPLERAYTAKLSLIDSQGAEVSSAAPVRIESVEAKRVSLPRRGLKPGEYAVHYELLGDGGEALAKADRAFVVAEGIDTHLRTLNERLAGIKAGANPARAAMAESAAYIVQSLERARREYYASAARKLRPILAHITLFDPDALFAEPFDAARDLKQADAMLDALDANQNFFASWKGALRMAYRSADDNTLQPYRVFVPDSYRPGAAMALIVALHGAACDENIYIDRFRDSNGQPVFPKLAAQRGYLLAAPEGRGPFGGYVNQSERDVLEALRRVETLYSVGPVFLTGHSMGGGGTWGIGFRHPEEFAALAPVAGGPRLDAIAFDKAANMPVFFAWAEKDELVPAAAMRAAAAAAGKTLTNLKTFESPGDDHIGVATKSAERVFDFFDATRKALAARPAQEPAGR